MKNYTLTLLLILYCSFNSYAKNESKKNTNTELANEISLDSIRCEKLRGKDLAEFKETLVQNCDLNKPYSASLSQILNEQTYFYCCQIKQ